MRAKRGGADGVSFNFLRLYNVWIEAEQKFAVQNALRALLLFTYKIRKQTATLRPDWQYIPCPRECPNRERFRQSSILLFCLRKRS